MPVVLQLKLGDCLEVLPELEAESVDLVVTDPPYGIAYMAQAWDSPWRGAKGTKQSEGEKFRAWCLSWMTECYRLLVPGGGIKVFGATRRFHWVADALEKAGFTLGPGLEAWLYGSGFPPYLDVSKAIDQHLDKIDERPEPRQGNVLTVGHRVRAAATDEAAFFEGWATALRPSWEPFIVGTKRKD